MGTSKQSFLGLLGILVALLGLGSGCQVAPPVTTAKLLHHQAMIDFSGLKNPEVVESLKTLCAPPQEWQELGLQKTAMYTHQQWKSPSTFTGVGVAYVKMPLPLPARALVWLAKNEYAKKGPDGRIIGEWTDAAGRQWFEAENSRYHVRGYAITKGFEAWIIYCGYKVEHPLQPSEVSLAVRSAEAMIPMPFAEAPTP